MSLFTRTFRSAPIMTTRQGVVIVPSIAAGWVKRATSSLNRRRNGHEAGTA